jgi:methyl-accepting chemotaxis protein
MSIKRSVWAAPVTVVILFGLVLAMMVYLNLSSNTVRGKYPLLTQVTAVIQDVDNLNNGFAELGGAGRSLEALAAQAQQVRVHLRALGALPQQAQQSERLAQQFEAWYRPAMQARLMQALEDDPIALSEVIDQHYSVLQLGLEDARLLALGSFAESASIDNSRVKHMLGVAVAVSLLVISILGRMAWTAMRVSEQLSPNTTSSCDKVPTADGQHRALALLKSIQVHIDTLKAEARNLIPAASQIDRRTLHSSKAGPQEGSAGKVRRVP